MEKFLFLKIVNLGGIGVYFSGNSMNPVSARLRSPWRWTPVTSRSNKIVNLRIFC